VVLGLLLIGAVILAISRNARARSLLWVQTCVAYAAGLVHRFRFRYHPANRWTRGN
jgi:hypothetical protein